MTAHESRPVRAALAAVTTGTLVAATIMTGPAAMAAGGTFTQPTGITINDRDIIVNQTTGITIPTGGAATPYPSQLAIAGHPGVITDVNVTLGSLDHDFPRDIDLQLVGPGGQQALLMSDADAGTTVNKTFTLDDEAAGAIPNPIVEGASYQPTNTNGGDGDLFPVPAPDASTAGSLLSVFDGASPNGTWSLFVVDDNGADVGDFSGGWGLQITTTATVATATPYPSSLAVSGLPKGVTDVNLTLSSYDHPNPDDVDVMVVGPGGQQVVVMSDVGGSTPVTNATITLDDEAAAPLPDAGPVIAGTFKPTNVGNTDTFPAPAPDPGAAAPTLAAFDGTDPNGTWQLFVVDDLGGDPGDISGGWSLQITTVDIPNAPVITAPGSPSTDADGTIQFAGTAQAGSTVRVRDGAVEKANTVASATGAWSVALAAVPNGPHTYTATATDGFGNVSGASTAVLVRVDTIHPKVVRVRPAKGADEVRRGANLRASFSEAMRAGTMTRANVRLVRAGTARAIKARVTYDRVLRKVKINPRGPLAGDTRYKVIISTRVRDLAGNALDQRSRSGNQRLVWRFTTR